VTDHRVEVIPSNERGREVAAFRYRCSCGAQGTERVALNKTKAKRNAAFDDATRDAIAHQREAAKRGAR
jgi:hypothetical protein